jgi:hypothetical protein
MKRASESKFPSAGMLTVSDILDEFCRTADAAGCDRPVRAAYSFVAPNIVSGLRRCGLRVDEFDPGSITARLEGAEHGFVVVTAYPIALGRLWANWKRAELEKQGLPPHISYHTDVMPDGTITYVPIISPDRAPKPTH